MVYGDLNVDKRLIAGVDRYDELLGDDVGFVYYVFVHNLVVIHDDYGKGRSLLLQSVVLGRGPIC